MPQLLGGGARGVAGVSAGALVAALGAAGRSYGRVLRTPEVRRQN